MLDPPVDARFARLLLHSSYSGTSGGVSLGEWKVVATPGFAPTPDRLNIADPIRGGHIAWMTPQPGSILDAQGILTEDPTPWRPIIGLRRPIRWVIGFKDDRAARVEEIAWVDPPGSEAAIRSSSVDVEVSVASPLGPWTSLGTWEPRARRRRSGPAVHPPGAHVGALRAPIDGRASRDGVPLGAARHGARPRVTDRRDVSLGASASGVARTPPASTSSSSRRRSSARTTTRPTLGTCRRWRRPLPRARAADGRVTRNKDVDWYAVEVPEGLDVLELPVVQSPGAGVALTLQDEAGTAGADLGRALRRRRRRWSGRRASDPGSYLRPRRAATAVGRLHVRHERQHGRVRPAGPRGAAHVRARASPRVTRSSSSTRSAARR